MGRSQQCIALAMRQVLGRDGRAADFDHTAFGQAKFLIRIGGKSQPNFLPRLNEAGCARGCKQRCDQWRMGLKLWGLGFRLGHHAGDGLTRLNHCAQGQMERADLPRLWRQHAAGFAQLIFGRFLIEAGQAAIDLEQVDGPLFLQAVQFGLSCAVLTRECCAIALCIF